MALSDERVARWSRQLLVPGVGEAGQERLGAARVRVVGAGTAAGPALAYLVEAGVGKVWIDDPEAVGPADAAAWLYPPSVAGTPRTVAAQAALEALSRFAAIEPYPTGGVPTAALICAPSVAQALAVAEQSRRARIPHVVIEVDADGGGVVAIPPGAPCYACARSTDSAGRPPAPGAAAVGALGAGELLLLLCEPGRSGGRKIDVVRGVATARPTTRLPGCACAAVDPAQGP
ncbi:MAG TPA: ThiF family adenylyltransferase [Anaeromyxobacteraceae bacterium]|nr:ThiF family adenylyltransferase [Anaeromyxobacteraceae bacterium]